MADAADARGRAAHDGVHLSLRAGDALPRASRQARRSRPAVSLSLVPLAGLGHAQSRLAAGQETRRHRRTRRHAQPSHRLRASPRRPDEAARRELEAIASRCAAASRTTSTIGWRILAEFQNGATGVLESSKLASGRNESWRSLDYVEINGSERSLRVHHRRMEQTADRQSSAAPAWRRSRFRRSSGSGPARRAIRARAIRSSPSATTRRGNSSTPSAISARARPASTTARARQAVMDAAVKSAETRQWVDLRTPKLSMNKTAVITGAGSGVGARHRRRTRRSKAGAWRSWAAAREALQETDQLAGPDASRIMRHACDIGEAPARRSDGQTRPRRIRRTSKCSSTPPAPTPRKRALEVLSLEDYHAMMDANLNGAYYCVQAFLPQMRARESGHDHQHRLRRRQQAFRQGRPGLRDVQVRPGRADAEHQCRGTRPRHPRLRHFPRRHRHAAARQAPRPAGCRRAREDDAARGHRRVRAALRSICPRASSSRKCSCALMAEVALRTPPANLP